MFEALGWPGELRNITMIDPLVDCPQSNTVGALVSYMGNALVSNCKVLGGSIVGKGAVGGLVGQCWTGLGSSRTGLSGSDSTRIINCHVTTNVSGDKYVGGIIGSHFGRVHNCSAAGIISGDSSVGGLVGTNSNSPTWNTLPGEIKNSYSTCRVSGTFKVGGLVGVTDSQTTIVNCYATGQVTANSEVGGVVGRNSGASVSGCFWDQETSGLSVSSGGTGLSTAQMQDPATYLNAGWDIVGETANGTDDIWTMPEGDYPELTWQPGLGKPARSPDLNRDGKVDFIDFSQFAQYFLQAKSSVDMAPSPLADGKVDVQDLSVFAEYWLKDSRLIAHWKLDETEGTIAHDSIGENDGTVHGEPVWQRAGGQIDGALQFDGIDDYVHADSPLEPMDLSLSVFAWVKGGAPGQVIISEPDRRVGRFIERGSTWLGTDSSDGKLITTLMDATFGPLESEAVITDGQWHHVGLVYDFDGFHRRLYVDGAEVAKDTGVVAAPLPDGDLYFGAAGKDLDVGSFFSGLIDEVRAYNRALSAEEIEELAR
jgi:hypothetical protein